MKRTLCIILACVLALSLAGCGGKTTSKDEAVTLKLGLPAGKDLTPVEIVDNFKAAHPNITLEIDETPWNEFKQKLKMQVATSNPPTTFIMDSGYVATLGGMGASVDLMDWVEKDLNKDDYSATLFAGRDGEGHLWGIPHALNSVGIYYNKTMFDKAGIPYPDANWTWDDLFDIARKLTKDLNGDGTVDQYGFTFGTNITEGWLPFVSAMGGTPLDEARKKSNFKDEKVIEGFKKSMIPNTEGFAPGAEWTAANGNSTAAFYMGKIGMMMTQSSGVKAINKNAPADFKYDVQVIPIGWDGNRHVVYVPNQFTIFSKATEKEQKAAWTWIKHFISEDSQKIAAEYLLTGYPIRKSALEYLSSKETVPANMKVFYEYLDKDGVTLFENKTFEEWRPKVDQTYVKMRKEGLAFDAGMAEIDKLVTEALAAE